MIYHLIVAVPDNFDIEYHLKMRELANIPHTDELDFYPGDAVGSIWESRDYKMDVEMLRQIASSIASSEVTTLMSHRPEMFEKIAEIFNDLGLALHYKKDQNSAVVVTRNDGVTKSPKRFLFTCVNVLRIFENKQWKKTLEHVVELEDYYPPQEVIKEIRAAQ